MKDNLDYSENGERTHQSAAVHLGSGLPLRLSQVLNLASVGKTDKEIAAELGIQPQTVESHWKRLRELYGLSSRAAIVAQAMERVVRELREESERLRRQLKAAHKALHDSADRDPGRSESNVQPSEGQVPANLFQEDECMAWHPASTLRRVLESPPSHPIELKGFAHSYSRPFGSAPGTISARALVEEAVAGMDAGKHTGVDLLDVWIGEAKARHQVLMRIVRDHSGSPLGLVRVSCDVSPWIEGSAPGEFYSLPVFR